MPQEPPSDVTIGVDQGKAPTGLAEALDRPAVLPGTSGLAPWTPGPSASQVLRPPPAWPPCSWQPTAPLASEEAQSCPGLAGPLTEETAQAAMPGTGWVPYGVDAKPLSRTGRALQLLYAMRRGSKRKLLLLVSLALSLLWAGRHLRNRGAELRLSDWFDPR
ncbi:PREDICTED: spermatogenesis- and oogenesis-specific basic helix-loop-helix-containing protein 1 [Myotis davidii]|uniref:spermatogenesis- and oogenesis-specific basic helix-loop-helix-containing protein 1 n=1 Tax=Myotis davidii TaxID=225400 RepID=UPI0007671A6A|nr:PREDICTED: spermatogenesis- and oogenesis-specific basic helix-loop-helix-containing protein 1 [Myotis davidii]